MCCVCALTHSPAHALARAHVARLSLSSADDSRYLISGAADSTCRVWDVESGAHLFTFKHETTVRSCAFAPRATHVVTVSEAEMKRDPQLHFRRFVPNECTSRRVLRGAWRGVARGVA